jgi:hypothetical protein
LSATSDTSAAEAIRPFRVDFPDDVLAHAYLIFSEEMRAAFKSLRN